MKALGKKKVVVNGYVLSTATKREPKLDDSPIDPAPLAPDFSGTWALVYTAPRKEAQAVADLIANGWPAWCPMMTVWITTRHVKRREHRPLFPRYAFVALAEHGRTPIRECKGVAGLIGQDEPFPVPLRVIEGLSRRQEAGEFDQTVAIPDRAAMFRIGEQIRMSRGPMEGLDGRIVSIGPDGRIRLLMMMLGGEIAVEAGVEQIAAIR